MSSFPLHGFSDAATPKIAVPVHTGDWTTQHTEGELAVDVYETTHAVIVLSAVAGADMAQTEISLHHDVLTIRGERTFPLALRGMSPVYTECFWGKFSRTIILPCDVKTECAVAEYERGILTIHIPKKETGEKIPIRILDE